MSDYYRAERKLNIYDPKAKEPYPLSRVKVELFLQCRRCFYLDRRLGVDRPRMFPFNLNNAVDALVKKECDLYRAQSTVHPMAAKLNLALKPWSHPNMDAWRDTRRGVRYHDPASNFELFGGLDDIWSDAALPELLLHIVDCKATSKKEEVTLDHAWQIGYKRQVEIYQWLVRKNGFLVSDIAYFLYHNAMKNKPKFENRLDFAVSLIPYRGDASWVSAALIDARTCLSADTAPQASPDCDYCNYTAAVLKHV